MNQEQEEAVFTRESITKEDMPNAHHAQHREEVGVFYVAKTKCASLITSVQVHVPLQSILWRCCRIGKSQGSALTQLCFVCILRLLCVEWIPLGFHCSEDILFL